MTNGNGQTNGNDAEHSAPAIMTPEQFAVYIEKRLSIFEEDIELLYRADMVMRLRVQGRNVEANLAPYYEVYLKNPAQIDAVARTFLRVIQGETSDRSENEFGALADRVYPMLKKIDLLVTVRERGLPMLVYREFLANLIVTYVIDETNSVSYINEQHLDSWNISSLDLHEQALDNLRRRTLEQTDFLMAGEGDQRLFIFNSGDGYDATRMLLTDILAGWARELPGNLIIGIPNRDFLIAFSDADGDILQNIAHQIQADSVQQNQGLTEQLFTLKGEQVREYEWE